MRTFIVALSLVIARVAANKQFHRAPYGELGLIKRQYPDECGVGDTCIEACGAGWEQCGNGLSCYHQSAGDICCGYDGKQVSSHVL